MKKHNGSILSYLNKTTQAAGQGAGYVVEQIDVTKIQRNEKNFYSIEGIEELANSLAVSDNVAPLEVVANEDGTYRLISGERRLSATLYRIERGELESAQLPCHILPAFEANDVLSAEQVETLAIVLANNYRQKTALDQLKEIEALEPIAKAIYEEEREKGEEKKRFRAFFAEQILNISDAALKRLQMLTHLTEEMKVAFDKGIIGKSVAMMLSTYSETTQNGFLEAVECGEIAGTVADVEAWIGKGEKDLPSEEIESDSTDPEEWHEEDASHIPTEEAAADEAPPSEKEDSQKDWGGDPMEEAPPFSSDNMERPDTSQENTVSDYEKEYEEPEESYEEKWEKKGQQRLLDTIPEGLSPEEAEKDANHWVIHNLEQLFEDVQTRIDALKEAGMVSEAAKWGIRLSTLKFFIETFRE